MKYAIVLCDGMADRKIEKLNNQTPMALANKPMMDALAANGEVGLLKTVPDGMTPGSDIANLSVMGYNPKKYYTGRSPLEALSIGVKLADNDTTFRCNLVTLSEDEKYENKTIIDYCAGDISTNEAKVLIEYVNQKLHDELFTFYCGVSYRHLLVASGKDDFDVNLTPPHDITGKKITDSLPKGKDGDKLLNFMKKSYDLLNNHPINLERRKKGEKPANSIWFWGEGHKPRLEPFETLYHKKGAVISAVDLLKGIGVGAGMHSPNVEGATGYIDTNFDNKLNAAINEFENGADLVYIHLEAPDECGHRGELQNKIRSIELIDEKILTPLVLYLRNTGEDFSVLVCPDHPTPIEIRTHSSEPVPYLIYRSNSETDSGITVFSEENAEKTGIFIENGYTIMDKLIIK